MTHRQGWGGAATLWGLLFGALVVVLVLGDRLVFSTGRAGRPLALGGLWARLVLAVLGLAFFFLAGMIAARSTRRIEAGIVAGLLAGIEVGVVGLIFALFAIGTVEHRIAGHSGGRIAQALVVGNLGRSAAALVLVALVGAGLGALGGLAGRGRPPTVQAFSYEVPAPLPAGSAMPAPNFTPTSGYAPDLAQAADGGHAAPPPPDGYMSHPEAPTITSPNA